MLQGLSLSLPSLHHLGPEPACIVGLTTYVHCIIVQAVVADDLAMMKSYDDTQGDNLCVSEVSAERQGKRQNGRQGMRGSNAIVIIHYFVQHRLEPSHASTPTAHNGIGGLFAVNECACGFQCCQQIVCVLGRQLVDIDASLLNPTGCLS